MDLMMILFTLVVNSSTLWSRPLYGLDDKHAHFVDLVVNSSTLWTQ